MIGYFTEADASYGQRVTEGLQQSDGRNIESGQSRPEQAVEQAKQTGHKADPY